MYTKTRSEELDISKGIAIFLVVWGHIIQYSFAGKEEFYENIIFRLIYGFHMPLFMIISGYLFFYSCEKYDLKRIVKKQFKNSDRTEGTLIDIKHFLSQNFFSKLHKHCHQDVFLLHYPTNYLILYK